MDERIFVTTILIYVCRDRVQVTDGFPELFVRGVVPAGSEEDMENDGERRQGRQTVSSAIWTVGKRKSRDGTSASSLGAPGSVV